MDVVIFIGLGILIAVMVIMIFTHSMALQQFGLLEIAMLIMVSICVYFSYNQATILITKEYYHAIYSQYSELYHYLDELESISDTSERLKKYVDLEKKLAYAMKKNSAHDMQISYVAASLVQRESKGGFAECYTVGEHPYFWSEIEERCSFLVEDAMITGEIGCLEYSAEDVLLVITDKESDTPQYAIVTQVSTDSLKQKKQEVGYDYAIAGSFVCAIGTVLFGVLIFFQYREVRNAVTLVTKVAEGKEDWQMLEAEKNVKKARNNEMKAIYKGLRQIVNDLERVNYEKYRALQIYYRFAPKDIEKVMGKQSILDVGINEQIEIKAVLAYISFNIDERLEQHEHMQDINTYYTRLGHNRKKYGGIIFNSSSDLSMIQMMFRENMEKPIHFAIELATGERTIEQKNELFVMLHHTSFVYGISGDDEQTFTYAHAKEWKALEKYINKLRKLGVRVAVTDEVFENMPTGMKCRYLGFINDGGMTYNVYEVLDAYSMKERQRRLESKAKYDEAIKLFYQADFYFARILFTEILKDCPDDDVVKHYIFRCEKCLNEEKTDEKNFGLF